MSFDVRIGVAVTVTPQGDAAAGRAGAGRNAPQCRPRACPPPRSAIDENVDKETVKARTHQGWLHSNKESVFISHVYIMTVRHNRSHQTIDRILMLKLPELYMNCWITKWKSNDEVGTRRRHRESPKVCIPKRSPLSFPTLNHDTCYLTCLTYQTPASLPNPNVC